MTERLPVSRRISVADVPPRGTEVVLEADAAQRAAIARSFDLPEVSRWIARLAVRPWGRDGLAVAGTVEADVTRICVVTLEPFPAAVSERVDVRFAPQAEEHVEIDPTLDVDPPDPLQNGGVDLGAVALEFFALGLDPYPRKPGVAFDAPRDEAGGESPFARLADLARPPRKP